MLLLAALALAGPPDVDSPLKGTSKAKKDAALVITVEDYKLLADVSYATRDGDSLQTWLSTTHGVERVERVQDPDRNTLRRKIDDAARAVRRGGTLWVYFSGHGTVDEDGRRILLTREAAPDDPAGVGLNDLVADLADSRAKQVVIVLDAGFAGVGRLGEPLGLPARDEIPLVAAPAQKNVSVWAAASGAEAPSAYPDAAHGMFTYFVLGALRGWADGATGGKPNGDVTLEEAQSYVSKTVKQVGGKLWNPSKETREDVIKWSLARSSQLEIGPDKDLLATMAQAEKARRVKEATDSMIAVANAEWLEIAVTTAVASPAGIEKLNAFIKKYELATVSVDGVATAIVVPQVADARARLDQFARDELKAKGKKKKKRGTKKTKAPPPPAVSVTAACDDLIKLEPAAMSGALTTEQIACVESKIAMSQKQTERDKLSRVLLANADSRADTEEWMRLTARHLEEIDRSDPDLCFRYALTLSRTGTLEEGEEVLKWIGYALENKQAWQGPTYMSRVYNLYRLQAEVATRMWIDAEQDFQEERSEENSLNAEEFRGFAKNTAREWLDYARVSGQDPDRAYSLCQAAAGSPNFCAETVTSPE